MHFPDNETPIDETLEALHELIQSGKIRYIGSSSFASWQISEAGWTAVTKDRSLSAQWEHTILVTKDGYEVLTLREEEK